MARVSFAALLTKARTDANMTRYALAKAAGLRSQTVIYLEEGTNQPNWETVQRLAAALGVDCGRFADPAIAADVAAIRAKPPAPRGRPKKAPAAPPAKRPAKRRK